MAYTLDYNEALKIVELVYTGRYTAQESRESTARAIALGKEHGDANALVDATEIELAASILDIYDLPNRQYFEQNMSRCVKIGLLLPRLAKEKEEAYFYETVCINRGWQVQSFTNRDDAIAWLTDDDSSSKQEDVEGL